MLENYISIPSSLSQTLSIEDKNLKIKGDQTSGFGRDRRTFIPCRGCGGKAENDEYDSTDKDGVSSRVRITRCLGTNSKNSGKNGRCLPYKEALDEKEKDRNNMLKAVVGSEALYKVDDLTVKKYARLSRAHKEDIAKEVGMSSKYVGFALRRSVNRKLLSLTEKDALTYVVMHKYADLAMSLEEGDPTVSATYANKDAFLDVGKVKFLEEEMLEVLEGSEVSEVMDQSGLDPAWIVAVVPANCTPKEITDAFSLEVFPDNADEDATDSEPITCRVNASGGAELVIGNYAITLETRETASLTETAEGVWSLIKLLRSDPDRSVLEASE